MRSTTNVYKKHHGFSLVEILLTIVIIGVLAAFAIPNTVTGIANMRLRGAASNFSGLVQQARTTAVQNNKTFTILFGLPTGNGAYVDLNANGQYDSGEPMIQFGGNVNNAAAPGGATGKPTNLDASGGPLGWTATAGNLSFNARGLPCNSSSTPCGTNVNYIFYFSDTRYFGGSGWCAVSVTAAGHPKQWLWSGSSWIN
jgi:prepilin-type N-terminal cleavage/methylation domain-containing protein